MELEEIRQLTIEAVRIFSHYSDDTHNGPEMKQMTSLRKKIEELIYQREPNHPNRHDEYSNETPYAVMDKSEQKYFLECIHCLLIQGIIMWGKEAELGGSDFYPWFSITSYGKKVLEKGEIIPHDPNNYLKRLQSVIPKLDHIALVYVEESLQCFLNNNFFASAVMLGVASKAALNQLFTTFRNSNRISEAARNHCKSLENTSMKRKFDYIYNEIIGQKKEFNLKTQDSLEYNLTGIFNLIRLQRNEAGHPTGIKRDRDEMFANLTLFTMYCKTIYDLIGWLRKGKLRKSK